ncbi:MAG: hypothetical protein GY742_11385 [Hyphomicrobiales bacterium]|nr:hypothetical protein [Hyphomicrobiales bacterium]
MLDVSITERFEFNDNIDSKPSGAEHAVGSITNLNTILAWKGHRRTAKFNSNFDLKKYFGPGARPQHNTFNHFHKADFSVKRKTTTFDYSASFRSQDAASSVLDDTGIVIPFDTNRFNSMLSAKVNHEVNNRSQINFSGSVSQVDFERTSATLTPFFDIDLKASFVHKLTKRTTGTLSIAAGFHDADDALDTKRNMYRLVGKISTELLPRLSADIKVGAIIVEGSMDATTTSSAISGSATGSFFDIGLNYRMKTTNLSLTASNDVTPNTLGRLSRKNRLGFSVTHQINHRSKMGLSVGAISTESILGTTNDSLSIAPTYSYRLTKKLNANIGYVYRHQEALGIASHSNRVYFSLSRALSLLP